MKTKVKGFWCDGDGITVIEIASIVLLLAVVVGYFLFKKIDPVFGDIVIGCLLANAGQHVGVRFARRNARIDAESGTEPKE